jgi:hypothetical protein
MHSMGLYGLFDSFIETEHGYSLIYFVVVVVVVVVAR